ncbi:MAG: cytochrome c [Candidatus Eremiobacteraeota bacterium]|nr:cytochrome c [Candidatus Eremiobacteraeota bacterium]
MLTVPRGRSVAFAAAVALLLSAGAASRVHASAPALYTAAQATSGGKEYESKCSACHGEHLEGGAGPALSGDTLKTLSKNTKLSVGDAFSFLSQQMPLNEPASLTHDQYTSIMAFILKTNGYPAGSKPLSFSEAKISKVTLTPQK